MDDLPMSSLIFWSVLEAMLAAFAVRGVVRWLWARRAVLVRRASAGLSRRLAVASHRLRGLFARLVAKP